MSSLRFTLGAAALALLSACGGGGSSPKATPPPTPTPTTVTGTVTAGQVTTVQVTTGTLQNAAVQVPAGAMPDGTKVSIAPADAPAFGKVAAGPVVQLSATSASGTPLTAFTNPVSVSIPYVAAQIPVGKTSADLLIYTAPDANATATVVPGTTLDAAKQVLTGQVAHFSVFYVGVAAAPSGRTLTGTYRYHSADTMLWKSSTAGTPTHNAGYGNAGTIAFTDKGECTVAYDEFEFHERCSNTGNRADQVQTDGPKSVSEKGTYTLAADGHLVAKIGTGTLDAFVSADGKLITAGGAHIDTRTDGTMHDANTFVAIQAGTGKTLASLNGTYSFHTTGRMMWLSTTPQVHNAVGGTTGTFTFDGKGGFSLTSAYFEAMERFDNTTACWANAIAAQQDPTATITGTYTLTSDGTAALTTPKGDSMKFFLSADDQVFATGGANKDTRPDGTMHTAESIVGIKQGTALGVASMNGTYHMHSCDFQIFQNTTDNKVFNGMNGNSGTFVFDGKGGFTLTYTGNDMMEDYQGYASGPWATGVRITPEKDTITGTYTVDPDGTLKFSVTPIVYHLNPDGTFFSAGTTGSESRTSGTLYASKQTLAVKVK